MKKFFHMVLLLFVLPSMVVMADANRKVDSFHQAKRMLLNDVYSSLEKRTVYCAASFDKNGNITDLNGYQAQQFANRTSRIEWEHIVPAENFGRNFSEWREGHPSCVDKDNKPFKGRNCASKVNQAFRYMYADMYNLYPAIGSVNALRSNYNFAQIHSPDLALIGCAMQIDKKARRAEPSDAAKGIVARVYLYFAASYPEFQLSRQQQQLFSAWDKLFPVTEQECLRARLIEAKQGNINTILAERC